MKEIKKNETKNAMENFINNAPEVDSVSCETNVSEDNVSEDNVPTEKVEKVEEVKEVVKEKKTRKVEPKTNVKRNVYQKLSDIQSVIDVPKTLYNQSGNFYYRNAEGILSALKPYLEENKCSVVITDDIVNVGDKYYVKATVTFIDTESGEKITSSALARESLDRNGLDSSQLTGVSSSYARKYALNGMFLLDDTKDADTDEFHNQVNSSNDNTKTFHKSGNNGGKWNIQKA